MIRIAAAIIVVAGTVAVALIGLYGTSGDQIDVETRGDQSPAIGNVEGDVRIEQHFHLTPEAAQKLLEPLEIPEPKRGQIRNQLSDLVQGFELAKKYPYGVAILATDGRRLSTLDPPGHEAVFGDVSVRASDQDRITVEFGFLSLGGIVLINSSYTFNRSGSPHRFPMSARDRSGQKVHLWVEPLLTEGETSVWALGARPASLGPVAPHRAGAHAG